jgi:drug/metabolite transporter (DMT)-like permease
MVRHTQAHAYWGGNLALILATAIWGGETTLLHAVAQQYPSLSLTALRFGFAALALAPLLGWPRLLAEQRLGRRGWGVALLLGGTLYTAYVLYTMGLPRTTVARGSLLTNLCVVFAPLLARLILRERCAPRTLSGLLVAVVGLIILTFDPSQPAPPGWLTSGDGLLLASALAFALHIVLVSALAAGLPPLQLNAAQMVVVATLAVPVAVARDGIAVPTQAAWGWIVALGVVGTGLPYALQVIGQQKTTPVRAALIYSGEPVFAMMIAALSGHEPLTPPTLLGGGVLLIGILLLELAPARQCVRDNAPVKQPAGGTALANAVVTICRRGHARVA